MKTKTILILSSLLIVINIALGLTIYFMLKPDAKTAVLNQLYAIQIPNIELPQWQLPEVKLPEIEVPEIELPEVELPKIEVTEDDIEAVKESVKLKLLERAQLTGDDDELEQQADEQRTDEETNEYVVDQWGMTFHLPINPKNYTFSFSKDVLTIERHLQVMAYIARYDAGVRPAIVGDWELLASYQNSDYYVRKGSAITYSGVVHQSENDRQLEQMRDDVYDTILKTYHFSQE